MSFNTYKTLYSLVDPVIVEMFLKKDKPTIFPSRIWEESEMIKNYGSPILSFQFAEILSLEWLGYKGLNGLDPFTYPAAIVLAYYTNGEKPINILHTFLIATILKNHRGYAIYTSNRNPKFIEGTRELDLINQEIFEKLTDTEGLGKTEWEGWRIAIGNALVEQIGFDNVDLVSERLYNNLDQKQTATSHYLSPRAFNELESVLYFTAVFNKVLYSDSGIRQSIVDTLDAYEEALGFQLKNELRRKAGAFMKKNQGIEAEGTLGMNKRYIRTKTPIREQ